MTVPIWIAFIIIVLTAVGRLVRPERWNALPAWGRAVPLALIAGATALYPAVVGDTAGDVLGTAWAALANAAGAVAVAKVLPWSLVRTLLARTKLGAALGLVVLLSTGCAALTPAQANLAGNALSAACALQLVQHGAAQAQAELEGVPLEWLAEQLCRDPQAYAAWLAGSKSKAPGAGPAAALASARARGLIR